MVSSLIQDTITFLRQQTDDFILTSDENRDFFVQLPKQKIPTVEKPKPIKSPPLSIPKPKPMQEEKSPTPPQNPKSTSKPTLQVQKPIRDTWNLEKTQQKKELNFTYLEQQIQKALPDLALTKTILSDEEAKKIANRWKWMESLTPITIFSTTPHIKEKRFLQQLAKAIEISFCPCRVINPIAIERENQWESILDPKQIQMILSCDYEIWSLKNLVPLIRKLPQEQKTYLKDIPVLLLPDLKVYFRDSSVKRSLWKTLCQKLQASS